MPTRHPGRPGIAVALVGVAASTLQVALSLPAVSSGRALDFGPFRVDGVALVFGTAWALAFSIAAFKSNSKRQAISLLLALAGLLTVAYAREPFLLYLGWEIATLGLWLPSKGNVRLVAALHLAGIPLLTAILLGLVGPFAPPPGGVALPWHIALTATLVAVILMRVWLAGIYSRLTQPSPLAPLYAISTPILLVKALVAAPFDPFGIWLLTLLGTCLLLVGAYATLTSRTPRAFSYVWIGAIITALGLSSGTPLAAAGAIWLMLSGSFIVAAMELSAKRGSENVVGSTRFAGIALTLALPGMWLIAQGALDLRYGLVAAVLLPCLAILFSHTTHKPEKDPANPGSYSSAFISLIAVLALALAVYPQLPVELAIQPAVEAMAGGVRALSTLSSDWGVGLMIRPTQVGLSAGLPATGIMLAVFLAAVTLYWLRRLARLFLQHTADEEAL